MMGALRARPQSNHQPIMKTKSPPLLLTAISFLVTLPVYSQTPPPATDPFLKSTPPATAATPQSAALLPREGLVRMEIFTLSLEAGRAAAKKFPKQADLHAWLGAELEKEPSTVKLERLMVLRVRGGQRSKLEEIDEYLYPTEFDPPQITGNIGLGQAAPGTTSVNVTTPTPPPAPPPTPAVPGAHGEPGPAGSPGTALPRPAGSSPEGSVFSPWPYTPASPQSFDVKNAGWTMEIEMTIGDDGQTVDLNLAPQLVRLCGLETLNPSGEVVQPVFETSKITTQVLTKFGQPTLAGTFSPPARAGMTGGNQEPLTRFLFITVTNPR